MDKNKKSRDNRETVWTTPYFFPLQNVGQNCFQKIRKFKQISPKENQNVKEKVEILENICLTLDVLLLWQRPIPKKQQTINKGNYVGNLTGESQEQR